MFQRILVPLDGSSRAKQALPVAARLAQASGGTVVLLRVVSLNSEFMLYPTTYPMLMQGIIDADLEKAKDYLDSLTRTCSLSGIHTETAVICGQAPAAILSQADAHKVDLIVMCSHGDTGLKRWALGSVAEKVSHAASVPVLLLREGEPSPLHLHAQETFTALVPLDGSAQAKEALIPAAQFIAALSAPARGALHLTRVVVLPGVEQISPNEREIIVSKAKQYLNSTVEHIREGLVASPAADLKLTITTSVTIDDDIATGIIRVAEDGQAVKEGEATSGRCDVIAMATHGYTGIERWAMGSITERVLHSTRLPLLIVRPPGRMSHPQC